MLQIDPLKRPPNAELELAGSKSITNRALLIAALAEGRSTLSRALFAEDTLAMINCLQAFGIDIKHDHTTATIAINGSGGELETPQKELWVRQSGTTARFILPLSALVKAPIEVDGDNQIRSRPQHDLLLALNELGVDITHNGEMGHLPLTIDGSNLTVTDISVSGETSSQYLSALLLVGPCLPEKITLTLDGNAVSTPYIQMTVEIMKAFGAQVDSSKPNSYTVHPTGYVGRDYEIETDASTASYFFAAAAASKGRVVVNGIGSNSIQGDLEFVKILQQMGAETLIRPNSVEVTGPKRLDGIDVSMKNISDTAPTLASIAPFASSPVRVTDIGFIQHKESDRVHCCSH